MKEQTLLEMKNKVESLTNVVQYLITEMNNIKDLSIGTLETVKQMPDYEKAIDQLKENLAEEQVKKE